MKRKLALFFILVPLMIVAVIAGVVDWRQRQQITHDTDGRLRHDAETAKTYLSGWLEQQQLVAKDVAADTDAQSALQELLDGTEENDTAARARFSALLARRMDIHENDIALVVSTGDIVLARGRSDAHGDALRLDGALDRVFENDVAMKTVTSWPAASLVYESDVLARQAVIERQPSDTAKTGWRDVTEETDGMALTGIAPILAGDQAIGAVVVATIVNRTTTIPDDLGDPESNTVLSVLFHDAIVSTNLQAELGQRALGMLASFDVVDAVNINGQSFAGREKLGDAWYRVSYEPIKDHNLAVVGSIMSGEPEADIYIPIMTMRIWLAAIILAGLIAILLLSRSLAGQIVRPIQRLVQSTREIAKGHLDVDIPEPNREDEIGDLANSIVVMRSKLESSYSKLEDTVSKRTAQLNEKVHDLERAKQSMIKVMEDLEKSKHSIESEKTKNESILTSVGEGVIAIDRDRKIILFNKRASELLGFAADFVMGKQIDDVIRMKITGGNDTIPVVETPIVKSMQSGKTITVTAMDEHNYITKDGNELPVNVTAAPLIDIEGRIIGGVTIFQDVTKEREVDRMKSEFVSVASHQLRTPLSASKWFIELLMTDDNTKLSKDQEEFIQNIYESNERMIKLVNSLLNVSRLESGSVGVNPAPTDLHELIDGVIAEIKQTFDGRKQKVAFAVPRKKIDPVNIDATIIRQVIINLLTNANKYTPENGTIAISMEQREKDILIEVKDSGVGIPREQQHRIFNKFFRADNVLKLQTEGSGLGLYIAKEIVVASGGTIWFESEEGKGTSFFFTLPREGSKPKVGEKELITG